MNKRSGRTTARVRQKCGETPDRWKERIELVSKLGECMGALKGLRPQVDEACRARIDKLLEGIGNPSVLWRDGEHAAGASSKTSTPSTEPASGKFKMSIFENLLNAAQEASNSLVNSNPIGSEEYERGIRLQLATERAAK